MRQSAARRAGILPPPDGYTSEEKQLERLLGEHSVSTLYAKLPTTRMKAIVALHFELGYKQELVAEIFGVSQSHISQEIKAIRQYFLGKPVWSQNGAEYKARPDTRYVPGKGTVKQGELSSVDLLKILVLLTKH